MNLIAIIIIFFSERVYQKKSKTYVQNRMLNHISIRPTPVRRVSNGKYKNWYFVSHPLFASLFFINKLNRGNLPVFCDSWVNSELISILRMDLIWLSEKKKLQYNHHKIILL